MRVNSSPSTRAPTVDDGELHAILDEFRPYLRAPEFTRADRENAKRRLTELQVSSSIQKYILAIIGWNRAEIRDVGHLAREEGLREGLALAARYLGPDNRGGPTFNVLASAKSESAGEKTMGDDIKIGRDAVNSAVGSHARFSARDVSSYKQEVDSSSMDDELKTFLKQVRDAIESAELSEADAQDARDDLAKLSDELEKPVKNPGRLSRLWGNLKAIAPTVSAALSAAASVAKLLEASHSH